MAKKKVEVLNAVVDGHGKGEVIEVAAKTADMLVRNGYAKEVKPAKKKEEKKPEPVEAPEEDKE